MKSNKASTLLGVVAAFAFSASLAMAQSSAAPAAKPAQPATTPAVKPAEVKKTDKKAEKLAVGQKAPEFMLPDTDGKDHKLGSSAGKIVVLTWFNADCPYVVKHFEANKTFVDLNAKYGTKVQFYAVNSNSPGTTGSGKERNAKAKKDWTIGFPILLDESGETGRAYNAKNTPYTVIIAADGTVAYTGAPDDDSSESLGKTNYIAKALDEMLAGKPVTTKETKPYGCGVKYKN
jgi:peroxiredoxin